MSAQLSIARNVFETHLDDVLECLKHTQLTSTLKLSVGKSINWDSILDSDKEILTRFLNSKPLATTYIYNGLFVSVIAAFEEYLRNSLMATIRGKVDKVNKYSDLDVCIRNRHMICSGKLLAKAATPPDYVHINYDEICKKLGQCVSESENFEINDVAFSFTPKITELIPFFDELKHFGINFTFDDIGRNTNVQNELGVSGTRKAANQLRMRLNKSIKNRNRIAHTSASVSDITPEYLIADVQLLKIVAYVITNKLLAVCGS